MVRLRRLPPWSLLDLDADCEGEEALFLPPRSFNAVQISGYDVIKTSCAQSIHGELYFYRRVPRRLSGMFPMLKSWSYNNGYVEIRMERVRGRTLSQMLVNHSLEEGSIRSVLAAFRRIHDNCGEEQQMDGGSLGARERERLIERARCVGLRKNGHRNSTFDECEQSAVRQQALAIVSNQAFSQESWMYENYCRKVETRWAKHMADVYVYTDGCDWNAHFAKLLPLLRTYEREKRGLIVPVVHGDPVLTNVVQKADGHLVFIDMRGAQGDGLLTLRGDATYDLAKLYQSLCGYDHVLAGREHTSASNIRYLRSLRCVFQECLVQLYPSVRIEDVIMITCSLFTSLIPLHESQAHRNHFASIAREQLNHTLLQGSYGHTCLYCV